MLHKRKNESPFFTIITVNHNNLNGLKNTIHSVLFQIERDFEFIVIDGASNDGSQEVMLARESCIDVALSEPDSGIFDAMNKGVARARGKFCIFLNSGDVFSSCAVLSQAKSLMLGNGLTYNLYAGFARLHLNGVFFKETDVRPWVPHQSTFIKTELIKEFKFDSNRKVFGDLDLWYRLKQSNLFESFRMPLLIADFELGGIGNHPNKFIVRYIDKFSMLLNRRKFFKLAILQVRLVLDFIRFIFYKLFGLMPAYRYFY